MSKEKILRVLLPGNGGYAGHCGSVRAVHPLPDAVSARVKDPTSDPDSSSPSSGAGHG